MKTVIIVHHTGDWGGGTKSLIDLCDMLRDDYNVIVCIPKGFPKFHMKIKQHGCDVHEFSVAIPFINIYSGSPPLLSLVTLKSIKSLKNIKRVGNEILELNPDIVIFNTIVTAVTAMYISKFTKVICIDRETLTSSFSKHLYRILLDKKLNAITFLSDYERKKMNFKQAKAITFPDCVNMDQLVNADKKSVRVEECINLEKYVILFMGGLSKIKGTDVILEAIDSLDERFMMVFAGAINESSLSRKQLLMHDFKYPSYYRFKKRVKKYYYKLKDSSKLYEAGLRDSMDALIIASDVVVFPSTSVHQPRPCIEAGAYGKPVIISDYEETKEFFQDGYNALTFIPGNAIDLAQKIIYAYEHKDKMSLLGKNNRLMTTTRHNFNDCKNVICSLIEKVFVDEN